MSASDSASTQNQFVNLSGTVSVPISQKQTALVTATAVSISPAWSGYLIQLPATGATVTLPTAALAKGCTYTFRMTANNATTAWTITAGAATMFGMTIGGPTTGTTAVMAAGSTNVLFGTGALKGDTVTLTSDGTIYYVWGYSSATTDVITFS